MRWILSLPIILAMFAFSGAATAHDTKTRAEDRWAAFTGNLPPCDDDAVLNEVQQRFSAREMGYWDSSLKVEGFDRIGTTANRPWGKSFIPTRFCHGRTLLSNGKHYGLRYSIIEDGGLAGFDWGVQWCVIGLDRNYHFAPGCQGASP